MSPTCKGYTLYTTLVNKWKQTSKNVHLTLKTKYSSIHMTNKSDKYK